MKDYTLKDIILGLRDDYQSIQSLLNVMKKSLRVDGELLNLDKIDARVYNGRVIDFYVPGKKKVYQLLGEFSKDWVNSTNSVCASQFETDDIIVLNKKLGVFIDPNVEKDFCNAGLAVLQSELVTNPPITSSIFTPGHNRQLHITVNGIRYSEHNGTCFDFHMDYSPSKDQVFMHTEFDEAHSVLLRNALAMIIPSSIFSEYLQGKIESCKSSDLEIPLEGVYFDESSYGFIDNKGHLSLQRVRGINHYK